MLSSIIPSSNNKHSFCWYFFLRIFKSFSFAIITEMSSVKLENRLREFSQYQHKLSVISDDAEGSTTKKNKITKTQVTQVCWIKCEAIWVLVAVLHNLASERGYGLTCNWGMKQFPFHSLDLIKFQLKSAWRCCLTCLSLRGQLQVQR